MSRRPVTKEVLRDLAIRSKNQCAFPGCDHPLLNAEGLYIAELCHIEAAELGGQRYNAAQTDEDRRAAANLVFLCHRHHRETDDEAIYTVDKLREMKRVHEALPEAVFNINLLLQRIEAVYEEQKRIAEMFSATPIGRNFPLSGPGLQDGWTPEDKRFYEYPLGNGAKFRFMMRAGWLHLEQTLADGAKAYYEVNEEGSLRETQLPYPLEEYKVVIPQEVILHQECVQDGRGFIVRRTNLTVSEKSRHYRHIFE